ncbi:MAG: class I SAM-dependent methyltransferase [Bacteroidota bacterium]
MKNFMQFSPANNEFDELERQLSCPVGEGGVEVGENMLKSNISMIEATIHQMEVQEGQHILELGHGNGGHLPDLLEKDPSLTYKGVEVSDIMHQEAQRQNQQFTANGQAAFSLYDGKNLPFPDSSFHKIFSVNTLYFWEEPANLLTELYRVLVPGGDCLITYCQKDFMKKIPFVQGRFTLYDTQDILRLIDNTIPSPVEIKVVDKRERVKSKSGDMVDREYSILKFSK